MKLSNLKVRGGTLAYTITIALVVFVLLLLFITYYFLNNQIFEKTALESKISTYLDNSIELYMETPDKCTNEYLNKHMALDGISIAFKEKEWGLYKIVIVTASFKEIRKKKVLLTGLENQNTNKALYLADNNTGLTLSGKSRLTGECYLPGMSVRRGSIEGQPFVGTELINGNEHKSTSELPKINVKTLSSLYIQFRQIDRNNSWSFYNSPDSIFNSFKDKTIFLSHDKEISVNSTFIGNIVIVSSKKVSISRTAVLKDIIIYAPTIEVEEGFEGSCQLYATERLLVGADSRLLFPSILSLYTDKIPDANLILKEDSEVRGDIILLQKKRVKDKSVKLSIQKNSRITGSVYCEGKVSHSGIVYGYMQCNEFELISASSRYENHLLNAVIDATVLPNTYVSSYVFGDVKKIELVKCIQ